MAIIRIKGSWASLHGIPLPDAILGGVLCIPDPNRNNILAFREQRWDGMIRLYAGNKFPAGCLDLVVAHLASLGHPVSIEQPEGVVVDDARFTAAYLPPHGRFKKLWPHQVDAVRAFFANGRSSIEMGTASGKSYVIAAAARYYWEEFGWRSLAMTSKKGLARQLSADIAEAYGFDCTVGQMGDGIKRIGDYVTVGTAATLIGFRGRNRDGEPGEPCPICQQAVETADVLFIDEAHHAGSASTWFEIAMACPARRRHGLTGTLPDLGSIEDLRLVGATGPVVYRKSGASLVEDDLAAKPKIAMVMHENASHAELPWVMADRWESATHRATPVKRYTDRYAEAYVKGVVNSDAHNRAVVRAAVWCIERGRKAAVLCRRRPHWLTLRRMMTEAGISFDAVWGATDTGVRDEAKARLDSGDVQAILATTILDEGEDVPAIDCIILAEGVKKAIPTLQRVGRGMRRQRNGPVDLWIVDFVPCCHTKLIEHALDRATAYERAGYEIVVWDGPWPAANDPSPADLLPFDSWDDVVRDGRLAAV